MSSLRPDHVAAPHPSRLSPRHPQRDEILRRHAAAVAEGRVGYLDPTSGFTVFTSVFLAARGYCCGSGCRHCPFVGATSEPSAGR